MPIRVKIDGKPENKLISALALLGMVGIQRQGLLSTVVHVFRAIATKSYFRVKCMFILYFDIFYASMLDYCFNDSSTAMELQ